MTLLQSFESFCFHFGGLTATTATTTASQQLYHLARPLHHHAQGQNFPCGQALTSTKRRQLNLTIHDFIKNLSEGMFLCY